MIDEDYFFTCPYCLEEIAIRIDPTGGQRQSFSYDCEVCCRPIAVRLKLDEDGVSDFSAERES